MSYQYETMEEAIDEFTVTKADIRSSGRALVI